MDTLKGKLVLLRPPKEEDLEYFASLKNDLRTQGWNQRLPLTFTVESLRDKFLKRPEKGNKGILAIEILEDGKLIGNISYEEGPARLGATIGIATGTEFWGKGYAQEAQEILLNFLFIERGILVARLWTQTGFPWAQKAAEKLGFRVGVRFRENSIIGGKYVDCLYMDMLREEYFAHLGIDDPLPDNGIKDPL